MARTSEHLTEEIARIKKAIKQKYNEFKLGIIDTEQNLENQYKPIINQLKKNYDGKFDVKSEKQDHDSFHTIFDESHKNFKPEGNSTPLKPSFINNKVVAQTSSPDVSSFLATDTGLSEASIFVQKSFKHPLTQKYMKKFIEHEGGKKHSIDHIYGPRYENKTLMVGDKPLQFDNEGNIIINNINYGHSEGLYELLFKRLPDDEVYDSNDLNRYKDILIKTNGHKKGYNFQSNVNRGSSIKYQQVIKQLFPPTFSGRGLTKSLSGGSDTIWWDNPNDLVRRLRHLVISTQTGNKSHKNEIINIIEELKEAHYITGDGNARFKYYLR